MKLSPHRRLVWGLVVALLVFVGPAVASAKDCASAFIEEPFLLPDGSTHGAGTLRLCRDSQYSPSATFHSSYVDRHPIGMLLGFAGASEEDSPVPFLMFVRNEAGQLSLSGYSVPGIDGMQTFRLERPRGGKRSRVTTKTLTAELVLAESPESIVLVAANIP
jgi:hypothetical protein